MADSRTRNRLSVRCPHCGEEVYVWASVGTWPVVTKLDIPVLEPREPGGVPEISWSEAEIEAELYYKCPVCGHALAGDLEDLQRLVKEQTDVQGDGA